MSPVHNTGGVARSGVARPGVGVAQCTCDMSELLGRPDSLSSAALIEPHPLDLHFHYLEATLALLCVTVTSTKMASPVWEHLILFKVDNFKAKCKQCSHDNSFYKKHYIKLH